MYNQVYDEWAGDMQDILIVRRFERTEFERIYNGSDTWAKLDQEAA